MFEYDEKILLIGLVTTAVITLVVILYLSTRCQSKPNNGLNRLNRVQIAHAGGGLEEGFHDKNATAGNFDTYSFVPLINSVDITPNDWNRIALHIQTNYHKYDAFVVAHGRDTLAYTASAVSYILENLAKPVIFTNEELSTALQIASTTRIPEVMILVDGKLTRAVKTTTDLTSPHYPDLTLDNSLQRPSEPLSVKTVHPKVRVVVIKLFPGVDEKFVAGALGHALPHGIVFETYGIGTSPTSKGLLLAIADMSEKGVTMISVSQMDRDLDLDARLIEAGVINGGNMTTPAAFGKLHYLLGNVKDRRLLGQLLENDFRGELAVYDSPGPKNTIVVSKKTH